MKKLLISALALASLVACSKEELVVEQTPGTISFDQVYVGKATRAAEDPSTTMATLRAFDAWGFMDQGSGLVFDQQRVTSSDGTTWTYAPLQYWLPNHMYYFSAISPVDDQNVVVEKATGNELYNGLGTISFTNVNGTTDLLYSATTVNTNGWVVGESKEKVAFTFNHLLSKVKFSFTNDFLADNYSIVVKDIKMTVPGDGELNVAVENWWDNADDWKLGTTTTTLEFGHMNNGVRIGAQRTAESDYERLTIPAAATQEYEVTFFVELYSGDVLAYSNALKTKIAGAALNMGCAYNFTAKLDETNIAGTALKPIEFEVVQVKEWEDGKGYNGGEIDTEVIGVSTADDITAALNGTLVKSETTKPAEVSIRLLNDIDLASLNYAIYVTDQKVNIDLNGKTLTAALFGEYSSVFYLGSNGKVTITGEGNVVTKEAKYSIPVWAFAAGAEANILGGTYTNAGDGCEVIYASAGGNVNIYGGKFIACKNNNKAESTQNDYNTLNLLGSNPGTITVYGGMFRGFDPANNLSENPAASFLANGYVSKEVAVEGDDVAWYEVLPASTLQVVTTFDELQNALNAGGENIKLGADIKASKSIFVNEGIKAVLDLNGYNITNESNSDELGEGDGIIVYGDLTINGNGKVSAVTRAVWARANTNAVVTINGGTYEGAQPADGGCELIYASGNGKIFINDGVFKAVKEDETSFAKPQYAALNLQGNGATGCSITVKGGKFYRFDPANNVSENPVSKGNFVAEGYMSYKVDNDWYAVTDNITRVSTEDELHAAFAKGGAIMLTKNIEAAKTFIVKDDVKAVLDLNGYNITNTSKSDVLEVGDGIIVYGDLTINGNGTVTAATRAIWARSSTGANVTINGGNYVGSTIPACEVIYASGNGKIVINDGTFKAEIADDKSFTSTQYAALNLHNNGAAGCSITVYGGKYYKFNPADNVSEYPVTIGNFVAEGYVSVAEGDYFVVKAE